MWSFNSRDVLSKTVQRSFGDLKLCYFLKPYQKMNNQCNCVNRNEKEVKNMWTFVINTKLYAF